MSLEIIEPSIKPASVLANIKQTLDEYEAVFSRFRPDSHISQLNQGKTIALTPLMSEMIQLAIKLNQLTNGAFNPHVNLADHGYSQSFEVQKFTQKTTSQKTLCSFPEGLIVKEKTLCLKPGFVLDFGGFLKGYLSEKLAEQHQSAGRGIIVNLGGDLTVRGRDTKTEHFEICIQNPVTKQDIPIKLHNQSLSTSGTYKRSWPSEQGRQHHLLDPSTNTNKNTDLISISVWGVPGAVCDAMATAGFNVNKSQWEIWQQDHQTLNYCWIDKTGQTHINT